MRKIGKKDPILMKLEKFMQLNELRQLINIVL